MKKKTKQAGPAAWLRENKYYEYQLAGAGKPHLYRRFGQHLIKKENV